MDVKATLETRQSKAGNSYQVVVIKLSDKSEKLVFLTSAEMELLRLQNKKEEKPTFFK